VNWCWDGINRQAYYRGNGTNVARLFPEVTLKFVLHDQIKLMFNAETKSPSLRDRLAIGATTGTVAFPQPTLTSSRR
jgi:hypothetical protein